MMNYLKLIRPINLIILALTMFLFRVCLASASAYKLFSVYSILSSSEFLLLVLASVFIAAGGYVINDIYDIEIDIINRPNKLIVGNSISEDNAYNLYKLLCFLGILCTLLLAFLTKNYRLSTLPIVIMVVLNFYAHTFKRQLIVGNFMIALSASFAILLIALFEIGDAGVELSSNESYIKSGIVISGVVYALFAFLTTFMREIIKDIEDVNGDQQYGCSTIPIVFGIKVAKVVVVILGVLILGLLISFVHFFYILQLMKTVYILGLALVFPLFVILLMVVLAKKMNWFSNISRLLKLFICIGLASMLYFLDGSGPHIFVEYINYLKKLL